MSRMTDFTVPSTVPGRTLHAFCCEPEGEVRAVLQLSHGMVEFIDRYKPLAEYLAGQGIVVVGHDHLGHGGLVIHRLAQQVEHLALGRHRREQPQLFAGSVLGAG